MPPTSAPSRWLFCCLLLSIASAAHIAAPSLHAQSAESSSSTALPGSLAGSVVVGAERTPLRDAQVEIVGTELVTTTDRQGRFEFLTVGAGPTVLTIRSSAIQAVRVVDVQIEPGKQTELGEIAAEVRRSDATSSETVTRAGQDILILPGMVVDGFRAGRSRALQQKKQGTNIVDVISFVQTTAPRRRRLEICLNPMGSSAVPREICMKGEFEYR